MDYPHAQEMIKTLQRINDEDKRAGLTPYYMQPHMLKSSTAAWAVRYSVATPHANGTTEYTSWTQFEYLTYDELRDSSLVGW